MKNPVLGKELRIAARSHKIAWGLFTFNAILAVVGLACFRVLVLGGDRSFSHYQQILTLYYAIIVAELVLFALVIIAETAGAIAGEREKQTLEILLTTPLTPWQIVWGKLLASISTVLLYMISGLPILSIVFLIGGIELKDILVFVFYVFVYAIYIGSVGIFFSGLLKKTILATICSYICVMFLSAISIVASLLSYVLQYSNDTIKEYGKIVALGVLSPAMTIIGLVAHQVGREVEYRDLVLLSINSDSFLVKHVTSYQWFWTSVVVQLLVALVLLVVTAWLIDPLKGGKRK